MRSKWFPATIAIGVGLVAASAYAQVPQLPAATLDHPQVMLDGKHPGGPSTFGTQNTVFVTVPDFAFTPAFSSWTYADTAGNQPMRYINVAGQTWLLAAPQLPSGALLQSLEFDFCNSQPGGGQNITLNLYGMDFQNNVTSLLGSINGAPGDGCTFHSIDLSFLAYTVDNDFKRLVLYAIFNGNADNTTTLAGAIIGYKLQVSPAGSQTFNDVAPGDFGYQFIQALAASGITGGCGGGNFCPNGFLTRAQMAVFLAKALGLSYN